MKYLARVALLGLAATAVPARAEFLITTAMGGGTRDMRTGPRPIVLSPPLPGSIRRSTQPPAIPIANGFGRQVPLAFAVRQIVPTGVKTTFGPGVDQAALVDWTGGGPWTDVLRTAVNPLSLHMTVRWMAISITAG